MTIYLMLEYSSKLWEGVIFNREQKMSLLNIIRGYMFRSRVIGGTVW